MREREITVLGGGVAGLAAAYAATRHRLPFRLHEGSAELGGIAVTRRLGEHLYDSGAHRLHARIPWVLDELKALMGDELHRVTAPSRIFYRGRSLDFPFSPAGLVRGLPPTTLARALADLVRARLGPSSNGGSFRDFALSTYGTTLAEALLLSYSRKLWGRSCAQLSPAIAGGRLRPLSLRAVLRQAVVGPNGRPEHLEGDFYYPRRGIGQVVDALATACPAERLRLNHRVTRIVHDRRRVRAIQINGRSLEPVDEMISTLPLSLAVELFDPPPPVEILRRARGLRFRNLILVVVALNRDSVSRYASTYFPEPHIPFTRVHEPRCRSSEMSPPNQTSLVVEIPCDASEELWRRDDANLVNLARAALGELGLIDPADVRDALVHRMSHAYPVQELGTDAARQEILYWCDSLENLTLIGRGSRFSYLHIHDLVAQAFSAVETLAAVPASGLPAKGLPAEGRLVLGATR